MGLSGAKPILRLDLRGAEQIPVRTLDAFHLASIEFLRARGQTVALVSFDERLIAGARALRVPAYELHT